VPFITSYGDVVFQFKQVYGADIIFLGYEKCPQRVLGTFSNLEDGDDTLP